MTNSAPSYKEWKLTAKFSNINILCQMTIKEYNKIKRNDYFEDFKQLL